MISSSDTSSLKKRSTLLLFFDGAKDTFPLVVGAIPFGIIFGTLADTVGLSFYATMGMSMFVFAGASQFVGITLVASGILPDMDLYLIIPCHPLIIKDDEVDSHV